MRRSLMKRTALILMLFSLAVPLAGQNSDLVLVTVNPCVVFDTRPTQGGTGAFTAGETRTFHVVGSTANFSGQGGTAGGCGVPAWSGGQPVAKAVFINFVAIEPQGQGTVKAWAANK